MSDKIIRKKYDLKRYSVTIERLGGWVTAPSEELCLDASDFSLSSPNIILWIKRWKKSLQLQQKIFKNIDLWQPITLLLSKFSSVALYENLAPLRSSQRHPNSKHSQLEK
jgi:hypothetical protein